MRKYGLLNFLFPMYLYCPVCGKAVDETRTYGVCDHCIRMIRFGHFAIDLEHEAEKLQRAKLLDSASAVMMYGLYEKRLIFELKYNCRTYISRILADMAYDRISTDCDAAEMLFSCDGIVPMPISPNRLVSRGFNQTEKIAKHLAKRMDIPMMDILYRKESTLEQSQIEGSMRYMNTANIFALKNGMENRVRNMSIMLLDDVYTTGATAYNAAACLKKAGVREIHLLVLASGNRFLFNKEGREHIEDIGHQSGISHLFTLEKA